MSAAERNWAGNYTYGASRIVRPATLEAVQQLVAQEPLVRALGSRHSFTALADSSGVLVSLTSLPTTVTVDDASATARVTGLATYGDVALALQARGWALANLASLPHISVAGSVSTGTHGSGDGLGALSTAVAGLSFVGADGQLREVVRGDADFGGSVVGLGALGVVVEVVLDVVPTYAVRQHVYTDLGWARLAEDFDAITSGGYSVSLFTHWDDDGVFQAWVKDRDDGNGDGPHDFFGARPAATTLHMMRGGEVASVTPQLGVPGPWLTRLPHFRTGFTPSRGAELQSEYLVPRSRAIEAFDRMRRLAPAIAPLLQSSEIRTVAADDLWLSSAQGHGVVGIHLTWLRRPEQVYAVLPQIETALLPLGARPHWGKCFVSSADELAGLYPRMEDFRQLRRRVDPEAKFGNDFIDSVLGAR